MWGITVQPKLAGRANAHSPQKTTPTPALGSWNKQGVKPHRPVTPPAANGFEPTTRFCFANRPYPQHGQTPSAFIAKRSNLGGIERTGPHAPQGGYLQPGTAIDRAAQTPRSKAKSGTRSANASSHPPAPKCPTLGATYAALLRRPRTRPGCHPPPGQEEDTVFTWLGGHGRGWTCQGVYGGVKPPRPR